jgi:hypothetical protein
MRRWLKQLKAAAPYFPRWWLIYVSLVGGGVAAGWFSTLNVFAETPMPALEDRIRVAALGLLLCKRGVRSLPRLPQVPLEPPPCPPLRRPARNAQLPEEVLFGGRGDQAGIYSSLLGSLGKDVSWHTG